MIERYTRPAMGRIWTEENKYRCWLQVEAAASTVLAEDGVIPAAAAEAIATKATRLRRPRRARSRPRSSTTSLPSPPPWQKPSRHRVWTPSPRWLHYGLTSNDIVDTAQALQIKEASALIRGRHRRLCSPCSSAAPSSSSTRPPSAAPTASTPSPPPSASSCSTGMPKWSATLARFDAAAEDMRVGKLSGAVGTFGHLKPEHEEKICARLGLKPAPVATQVIQRDRHAAYISTLAILGSTLDKIAVEVRHLQRTEVREAQEYFSEKQKGSSAMPHKKNPITSEQISGLARVLRGNAQAAIEDIAALARARHLALLGRARHLPRLDHPGRLSAGQDHRPHRPPAGLPRAHEEESRIDRRPHLLRPVAARPGRSRHVARRRLSARAVATPCAPGKKIWSSATKWRRDPKITALLSPEKLAKTFDYTRQLGNVDAIFKRVLGS